MGYRLPPSVCVCTFCLHVLALGGLSDVDGEHDDLGGHGGHLVAEAELVGAVHVCGHRVLAAGLSVAFVDLLPIRSRYLEEDGSPAAQ